MSAFRLKLVWPVTNGKPTPRHHARRRQSSRQALLSALRQQRKKIDGEGYFTATEAPELYELARAADRADGRRPAFNFRGVRFQIRYALLRRYVLDPDTGLTLIGGALPFQGKQ